MTAALLSAWAGLLSARHAASANRHAQEVYRAGRDMERAHLINSVWELRNIVLTKSSKALFLIKLLLVKREVLRGLYKLDHIDDFNRAVAEVEYIQEAVKQVHELYAEMTSEAAEKALEDMSDAELQVQRRIARHGQINLESRIDRLEPLVTEAEDLIRIYMERMSVRTKKVDENARADEKCPQDPTQSNG